MSKSYLVEVLGMKNRDFDVDFGLLTILNVTNVIPHYLIR
jgi:hypothetical protein